MSIDNQDAFEPLLCHRIKDVAHHAQVSINAQRDRAGKRTKVWRDSISYDWKNWHSQRLCRFHCDSLGENAINT
jgi:hypothetical protein